jgi:hypothetical protein
MNTNRFLEKIFHLNGYLAGVSELCHGLNYVPLHEVIPCLALNEDIFASVQQQISLASATVEACKECSEFESVDNWEENLKASLDKWIFNFIFSKGIIRESEYLRLKNRYEHTLIYLLKDILESNELQVWRFQIGKGCCYNYGFDNEAYAFKSGDKLFVINFGWAD